MNNVNIIGRMTRDPELRVTNTGKNVVSFSIAVNNAFKKDEAFFFRVTAWGQTADFVDKYLAKGCRVAVSGRLEQRKYKDSAGADRETVEITAEHVSAIDFAERDGEPKANPRTKSEEIDEYDPFAE
jgi:single-strand DNA-binding protein